MELIKKNKQTLIMLAAALALLALLIWSANRNGQDLSKQVQPEVAAAEQEDKAAEEKEAEKQTAADEARYSYVAQAGDSYSVLARKAVQTYGLVESVSLSRAQILAAEADLTAQAGSPLLNVGEGVEFDKEAVMAAVEKAGKLKGDALAGWQSYVAYVEFNTDANGEAAA